MSMWLEVSGIILVKLVTLSCVIKTFYVRSSKISNRVRNVGQSESISSSISINSYDNCDKMSLNSIPTCLSEIISDTNLCYSLPNKSK